MPGPELPPPELRRSQGCPQRDSTLPCLPLPWWDPQETYQERQACSAAWQRGSDEETVAVQWDEQSFGNRGLHSLGLRKGTRTPGRMGGSRPPANHMDSNSKSRQGRFLSCFQPYSTRQVTRGEERAGTADLWPGGQASPRKGDRGEPQHWRRNSQRQLSPSTFSWKKSGVKLPEFQIFKKQPEIQFFKNGKHGIFKNVGNQFLKNDDNTV